MTERLTKARAIELFRQQWTDMQKTLGDCPDFTLRDIFKNRWVYFRFPGESIDSACFLCEYDLQQDSNECESCPIDWGSNRGPHYCMTGTVRYNSSPISEILALPERKETEDDTDKTV